MKRILLAGATLLALTSAQPAIAADAPVYKGPAPAAAALFNWSGFYLGGDIGWIGSNTTVFVPAAPATAHPDPDGFLAGGHIGYRYQFPNNIVIGIEADYYGIFDGDAETIYPGFVNNAIVKLNWGGSLRGSLGFAAGRALFYVTGGGAWISYNGCTTPGVPGVCAPATSFDDTRGGWTVGGGLAYAFTPNLSARIEYLYADYGNKRYTTTGVVGALTDFNIFTHTVRMGMSWKF